MDKNEMLANCIENYIEKYGSDPKTLSLPDGILKIKRIYEVHIESDTLENIDTLWTFRGTAQISYIDSGVTTNEQNGIVGNAKAALYPNAVNPKEMLPEVECVTITKIER